MKPQRTGWRLVAALCGALGVMAGQTEKAGMSRAGVQEEVRRAAARHRVDPKLAGAVAKVESGFQQKAKSEAGAIGVMQLMPGTARSLGVNPWDCRQNIEGGVRHLRSLLERYPGNLPAALAAYNAGAGAVDKYGGVPPYQETKRYVGSVLSEYTGVAVTAKSPRKNTGAATGARVAVPEVGPCAGTEVAFDAAGRLYVRTRVVGKGCEPLR